MRAKIFKWWNQNFQSYKVYLALWSLLYFQSAVTILWWLRMATYCTCTVIHVELRLFSLAHTSYQMSDLYLSLTTKVKLYHFSFSTHSLISSFMSRNAHSNKKWQIWQKMVKLSSWIWQFWWILVKFVYRKSASKWIWWFWWILVKFLKVQSAWRIWWLLPFS